MRSGYSLSWLIGRITIFNSHHACSLVSGFLLDILALHTGKITRRVLNLVQQYQDMGSDISRIIFRIPGTWEGIQAAKDLEAQGIATHIILINR